jgi:membrane associated rhomboid family serine protease
MIPLRDVIPSRTWPAVTVTVIVLNTLVYLYQSTLGERAGLAFVYGYGLVPAEFSLANVVTSMFVHGGFLHFGGNMLYLWIFGDNVEDRLGHGRFVLFYLLCGFAAALAQTAMDTASEIPMIGASGAIAGVLGGYFVLYPHSRVLTLFPFPLMLIEVPAVILLGLWFLMNLLSGIGSLGQLSMGGVAFWAHAAGFVTGCLGCFVLRRRERLEVEWWDQSR